VLRQTRTQARLPPLKEPAEEPNKPLRRRTRDIVAPVETGDRRNNLDETFQT
jgi:hypothetical protein